MDRLIWMTHMDRLVKRMDMDRLIWMTHMDRLFKRMDMDSAARFSLLGYSQRSVCWSRGSATYKVLLGRNVFII